MWACVLCIRLCVQAQWFDSSSIVLVSMCSVRFVLADFNATLSETSAVAVQNELQLELTQLDLYSVFAGVSSIRICPFLFGVPEFQLFFCRIYVQIVFWFRKLLWLKPIECPLTFSPTHPTLPAVTRSCDVILHSTPLHCISGYRAMP